MKKVPIVTRDQENITKQEEIYITLVRMVKKSRNIQNWWAMMINKLSFNVDVNFIWFSLYGKQYRNLPNQIGI